MTKTLILESAEQAESYIDAIHHAADEAAMNVMEHAGYGTGIELLEKMKFEQIGFDPLQPNRKLNLVEQLNQSFTYLASFMAAELIFEWHPELTKLKFNLGTAGGSDLESEELEGIAAEVFAATWPGSNGKLRKDIKKVQSTGAAHKYVFFNCPQIETGEYFVKNQEGVLVWSLGS